MNLASPIEDVKGIGPKTSEILNHAGIFTLRDLIYHLPRDYQNFQQAESIKDLKPGQVTIKARVDFRRAFVFYFTRSVPLDRLFTTS